MGIFNFHEIRKGKLILEALQKYGVMNRKTLQTVVPGIKDRRSFQRTLKNLYDRKLLVKRYDYFGGNVGVFYQLNQKSFIREALAGYLALKPDDLKQKDLRYKELFHEQIVTQLAYYLNKHNPDALVLREHELPKNEEAQSIITGLDQFDQLKPDLLLIMKTDNNKKISIAVEYERTAKSKIRMQQKLNFYTQNTRVDGVIYFYSQSRIDHNLHELFIDKVLANSLRVKNYGKNFLLTSAFDDDVEKSMRVLFNRDKKHYPFQLWVDYFTRYRSQERRDEHFLGLSRSSVDQLEKNETI